MTSFSDWPPNSASETILATIRERCPEAETAMAAQVRAALQILPPRFQGLTVTETQVGDLLENLVDAVVTWQLTHSEQWGEAEVHHRTGKDFDGESSGLRARDEVRRGVLLGATRN